MKILKLFLENLASLKGAYEIDFEAIENEGGGVYAICGPTGSGKSTILDGICLALYGQTPRLQGNIGAEYEAPIMSRGCGECRAAVEFSLKGQRYRSSWRQYRSRGKADGRLQAPQVELARLDETACILATKKQEHREEIIRLTGLDFGRFTKVVMLAQGQFQNFLKMDYSGRGELLEKITGTEIYSEISRQVYQIAAEYQKKRNDLEEELTRLRGDLGECSTSEEMQNRSRELAQEAGELRKKQALQQNAERWHQECDSLREEEQQLARAEGEIAPLREKLALARKADAVYRDSFILLQQTRERRKNLEQKNGQVKLDLQGCKNEIRQAALEQERLQKNYAGAETFWLALKEKLPVVRQMDSSLASLRQVILTGRQNLDRLREELMGSRTAQQDGEKSRKELIVRRNALEQWQKEHQAEAALEENLQKFAGWVEQYQILERRQDELKKQTGLAEDAVLSRRTEVGQAEEAAGHCQKELEDIERKRRELQPAENEGDPEVLREELEQRRKGLADALETARSLVEKQENLERNHQDSAGQKKIADKAAAEYEELKSRCREDEKRLEHLKTLIQFVGRVADAEQLRKELHDGEPCPVCGALDHPYAIGGIPELSDEVSESRELERKLTEGSRRMGELKGRREAAEELQRQYDGRTAEIEAALQKLEELWQRHSPSDGIMPEDFVRTGAEELKLLDGKLQALRDLIRRSHQLAEEYRSSQQKLHLAEQRLTEARAALQIAEADAAGKKELQKQGREEARNLLLRYVSAVKDYVSDEELSGLEDLQKAQQKLEAVCRKHRCMLADLDEVRQKEIALEGRLEVIAQRLPGQVKDTERAGECLHERQQSLDKLQQQRQELFGDRNPDEEEKSAGAELERARQKLSVEKEGLENLNGKCREIEAGQKKLQAELTACSSELETENQKFLSMLAQNGFSNEDEWQQKRCNTDQMDFLVGKCEEWTRRQERYQTNLNRCREQEQKLPEEFRNLDRESLRVQIDSTAGLFQEKQQMLGRIQEQLDLIRKKGLEIQEKEQKLAQAQQIYDRWQELNAIIGSGNGDKFRRIVQGVTLDLVLEQANRQLEHMMDRYELLRSSLEDDRKCLDLKIIDHWQNDSERDIRNISGGESFVVSLALALGLSALKQGNLQVQSLFLDEGFGSLDEKNLENTVQMLANLNQAGRQIGLISHVEALKESVGTRIDVVPGENTGVSTLRGIGCTRL